MLSTIIFFMFANFFLLLDAIYYCRIIEIHLEFTFSYSIPMLSIIMVIIHFVSLSIYSMTHFWCLFFFRSSCFSSHGYNLSVLIYVNKMVFVFLHFSLCSRKIFLSIISISYYGVWTFQFSYFHLFSFTHEFIECHAFFCWI